MKCSKCGSTELELLSRTHMTESEVMRAKWTSMTHRKTPHALAVGLAMIGGMFVARAALSKAYKCRNCSEQWREWFT